MPCAGLHAECPKRLNCSSSLHEAPSTGKEERVKHGGVFTSAVSKGGTRAMGGHDPRRLLAGPSVPEILPDTGERFGKHMARI